MVSAWGCDFFLSEAIRFSGLSRSEHRVRSENGKYSTLRSEKGLSVRFTISKSEVVPCLFNNTQ